MVAVLRENGQLIVATLLARRPNMAARWMWWAATFVHLNGFEKFYPNNVIMINWSALVAPDECHVSN